MTQIGRATRDIILISYRRDDAKGASGRLYDWLRIAFGGAHVFRDVASMGVGRWRDQIDAALARSAVCVAVIGTRWATADNLLRLHDEDDTLRHELVTALASDGLTLLPTLVEGAEVPNAADLPAVLRPLLAWHAFEVTERGWEDDTRRLIAEIATKAAGVAVGPDLDTLLRDAGSAQQRMAELEQTRHLQTDQMEALRRTLGELTRKLAEAPGGERPGLAAAFGALARGDSLAAEDAFEREYEAQSRAANEARKTMAETARNIANLALLRDVAKAESFYRKALAVDPENAETMRLLGYSLILRGDLTEAGKAFSDSLRVASDQDDAWGAMAALSGLGEVLRASGDLTAAHQAFSSALGLAQRYLATDSRNAAWNGELSASYDRIGDVLAAQGDRPKALDAYREGLAIREALARRDSGNVGWQRDLSISYNKIGDILVAQGDRSGAAAAYNHALAIRQALAPRDPASTERQRDLSISHNKNGDTLLLQGDRAGALAAYRQGLEIAEALVSSDPLNTEWQRDLSISCNKIGDVLIALDDRPGALEAYQRGLTIREELAARDPANTDWQRDLSASHDRIGRVRVRQGDWAGALVAYRNGLDIAETLAARDRANTEWQRDLSISHTSIGNALSGLGDHQGALAAYRQGLEIQEILAQSDPGNAQWQIDLAVSCFKLGTLDQGQSLKERRSHLLRGRSALVDLKSAGQLTTSPDLLMRFDEQIASLQARRKP